VFDKAINNEILKAYSRLEHSIELCLTGVFNYRTYVYSTLLNHTPVEKKLSFNLPLYFSSYFTLQSLQRWRGYRLFFIFSHLQILPLLRRRCGFHLKRIFDFLGGIFLVTVVDFPRLFYTTVNTLKKRIKLETLFTQNAVTSLCKLDTVNSLKLTDMIIVIMKSASE